MRKIIILILALVFVAAGCNKGADNSNKADSTQATQDQPNVLSGSVSVNMDDSGFTPQEITVKKGTLVTFINNGSNPKWPASAPHPIHTDYPGFDPKQAVVAGQTWSFTFDKVGTWKYHDHLNPARRGMITVVDF